MRLEGCQAPAVRQRLAVRSHWQRRSHPSPERSDGWGTRHFLFGAAGRANNH